MCCLFVAVYIQSNTREGHMNGMANNTVRSFITCMVALVLLGQLKHGCNAAWMNYQEMNTL